MKKRILIVEDEEHIADGLRLNLESQGYETVIAGDGQTALEMWRQGNFDLILLDVMLPGKDGLEVCRTIDPQRGRASPDPLSHRP